MSANWKPVFEKHHPLETQRAIKITKLVSNWLENNLAITDHYLKIPHAVSAVHSDGEEINVDTERSCDEQDLYIGEEARLAPPESQGDRFWRRNTTRLTYWLCQFMYSLLHGDFPPRGVVVLDSNKLASRHTQDEINSLQKFLAKGMSELPENRYQNFQELLEALQWLEYKLSLVACGIPSSSTSRHLPQMPRSFYKKAITVRVTKPVEAIETPASPSQIKYEIQIWNPSYKDATKLLIQTPAQVNIGRKETADNKENKDITQIEQQVQEKDGKFYYTISVDGDRCLSRRHIEIQLPSGIQETPRFRDLGSTHGIMIFRDRSRSVSNSVFIGSGGDSNFVCPDDQHLKLGNTYIRIHVLLSDTE